MPHLPSGNDTHLWAGLIDRMHGSCASFLLGIMLLHHDRGCHCLGVCIGRNLVLNWFVDDHYHSAARQW